MAISSVKRGDRKMTWLGALWNDQAVHTLGHMSSVSYGPEGDTKRDSKFSHANFANTLRARTAKSKKRSEQAGSREREK